MKRIILLIICLFLITGCSANYEVSISEDIISEKITFEIYDPNKEISNICNLFEIDERETIENGKLECVETPIGATYNFSGEYETLELFINRTQLNNILNNNSAINDKIVTISFLGLKETELDISSIETSKISMNVEYEVLEHNADIYNEDTNTYSWTLTKDNVEKEIKLVYDLSESTSLNATNYMLYLILTVISVVTIVVILIVKSKNNKNNTL